MNKKWAVKRITLNLASVESEKLERYCASTGRPATDVIRELIRSLEQEPLMEGAGNKRDSSSEDSTLHEQER
ncbi:CopG family transcriptional regulator [Nostoc sp.]|uniref:CopG family transcriptional regulator n=1 Tax=Nostoc punctiforme NIES-2108 TaxID=1356359 RepID=A0A367S182_NOSPU|nr:hypothetical protein A6769_36960 [Nostoc punctiforme NIES-2108]